MARTFAQGLVVLVLTASLWALGEANRDWGYGFNNTVWGQRHGPPPSPACNNTSRTIVVGGSQNWTFGFNYSDWALKNGPFYLNDTLVFRYDPPSANNTHPHNVYLFTNYWSYSKCDLSRAKLVANETQGGGDGFAFLLKWWGPHYFACGASNGFHCSSGGMKFVVMPFPRRWHY